jgi:hypothetical protein
MYIYIYMLFYYYNNRLIVKIETNICINNYIIIIIIVVNFKLKASYMFKIIIINTFNNILYDLNLG